MWNLLFIKESKLFQIKWGSNCVFLCMNQTFWVVKSHFHSTSLVDYHRRKEPSNAPRFTENNIINFPQDNIIISADRIFHKTIFHTKLCVFVYLSFLESILKWTRRLYFCIITVYLSFSQFLMCFFESH